MSDYYDRDGRPMTGGDFARRFSDPDYKIVAKDKVGDYTVSTVWLGIDHGWGGERQIFETMLFGDQLLDQECTRYATEEQARAGHQAACERIGVVGEAFSALLEQTRPAVRSITDAVADFGEGAGLDYAETIVSALFAAVRAEAVIR